MAAPIGNEYYKIRSKDGRDKIYTPEELLKVANEYFAWCIDNPFHEEVLFHYQGQVTRDKSKKLRPFSIEGFCVFADIARQTFLNYSKDKDFIEVTTRAREIIESQQFAGAASGFLNANIIARKLGLADNSNTKVIVEQPLFDDE